MQLTQNFTGRRQVSGTSISNPAENVQPSSPKGSRTFPYQEKRLKA
jgi:hypothetical protein